MKTRLVIFALVLTAASMFASGCGKSSDATTSGAPAVSGGPKTGDSAPGKAGIVATCVKGKDACVEYKNVLPDYVEEMCKAGPDYVFRKGSTPCPTEKLLGTCASKAAPDETSYWYGNSAEEADVAKGVCDVIGQWTPAPKAGATAAPAKPPPAAAPAGGGAKKPKK